MTYLPNQRTTGVIPSVEGCHRNTCFIGYVRNSLHCAIVNNPNIVPLVNALFFSCRPLAVFWGVWSVIVDALNTVFRPWSAPHIRQEVFERFLPSLADKNAAPAIIFIRLVSSVSAAFSHVNPRYVFWAVRHSVARLCLGYLGARFAPTAGALAAIKVSRKNMSFISAYALTRYVFHCINPVRVRNNCPVAKGRSDRDVCKFHVAPINIMTPLHYNAHLQVFAGA